MGKNTAHIKTTTYIHNTNEPKAEFMFLLGCYLSQQSWDKSWGNRSGGWWLINNTVQQLHVSTTLYIWTVHHNCRMAVKKWIQTFYTHPTFFTELGSPWLEYTPVKLGPFVGSTSLMTGKKQRKLDKKQKTKTETEKKPKNNNTWSGFCRVTHSHSHTLALRARTQVILSVHLLQNKKDK